MNPEAVVIGRPWDPSDKQRRIEHVWSASERRIGRPDSWDRQPDAITQRDLAPKVPRDFRPGASR